MADDKRTTPGAAERARRRRPAPTIDVTATEIDPPHSQQAKAYAAPPEAEPAPQTESKRDATPKFQPGLALPYLTAGLTGVVLLGSVLFALWINGTIGGSNDVAAGARIAALEAQLRNTSGLSPAAADKKSFDDLNERIGRIEQAVGRLRAPDGAATERLGAVENSLNAFGIALAALNRRSEEVSGQITAMRERADSAAKSGEAKSGEAEALQARIAALETAAKAAAQEAVKNSGADAAARFALAAVALRDTVLRGEPFAARLAAIKALGADANKLAPLETFAATGVPSEVALARQLTALVPALAEAAGANAHGGFFERLQANAGKLVRVRPVDEPAGDDPAAVLARIEIKAARSEMSAAQAELARLPSHARALAEPWSRAMAARKAALAAAQTLADDASLALGKP